MSAHAFGDDQMRSYFADALAAADSPFTVPHDPKDPWGVLLRAERFDYSFMGARQDCLIGLLDGRPPEAVARGSSTGPLSVRSRGRHGMPRGLVHSRQVPQPRDSPAPGPAQRAPTHPTCRSDIPFDHINLDRSVLIGPRAMAAIEGQLDRITGTTADSRWRLITPIGDAVSAGFFSPPAWPLGSAPAAESPPATVIPLTDPYLYPRTDTMSEASHTDSSPLTQMSTSSLRIMTEPLASLEDMKDLAHLNRIFQC